MKKNRIKIQKEWKYAILSAFCLLILHFLLYNVSIPLDDTETFVQKWTQKINKPGVFRESSNEVVLFVNTSYDQELVPRNAFPFLDPSLNFINQEKGGTVAKTDRKKIFYFLKNLQGTGYKHVIIDISLSDDNHPYNDSIVDIINAMSHITLAKSIHEPHQLRNIDKTKIGCVGYRQTSFISDMTKIELYNDSLESVPLIVYKDLSDTRIHKNFWGFLDNFCLSHKCIYPIYRYSFNKDYDKHNFSNSTESVAEDNNLGELCYNKELLSEYAKGKIVVVGNTSSEDRRDWHYTYKGAQPGCVILATAIMNLLDGDHQIGWIYWMFVVLLFCLYTFLSYYMFSDIHFKKNKFLEKIKALKFVLSFMSLATIFVSISFVMFLLFSIIYFAWIPTLYFTILYNSIKVFRS